MNNVFDIIESKDYVKQYATITAFLTSAATKTDTLKKLSDALNVYDNDALNTTILLIFNNLFVKYSDVYHYAFETDRIFENMILNDIQKIEMNCASFGDNSNGFTITTDDGILVINIANPDAYSSSKTDGDSLTRYSDSPLSSGAGIDNVTQKNQNDYSTDVVRKFSTIDERNKAIKNLMENKTFVNYIESIFSKYIYELNCFY